MDGTTTLFFCVWASYEFIVGLCTNNRQVSWCHYWSTNICEVWQKIEKQARSCSGFWDPIRTGPPHRGCSAPLAGPLFSINYPRRCLSITCLGLICVCNTTPHMDLNEEHFLR
jgi:hypothetical protein